MKVNMKSLVNVIEKKLNTKITRAYMELAEVDEESTTVLIALQLENGQQKMIEYQYDNHNPHSYGYNVEEFDPTCFKAFSKDFFNK